MPRVDVVYSDRRTVAISVRNGVVTVRAPRGMSGGAIRRLLDKHNARISKMLADGERRAAMMASADADALRAAAREYIPPRAEHYARIMGVTPAGVKITSAKTRFGSCSGKNSLCFSLYLMAYPKEAVDAVIVHELAHIRHKNHGERFYAEVEKVMPDYRARAKMLKNGIL